MGSLFSKTVTLRQECSITPEEFVQLRDFIYDQCGIFIQDNRQYLLENRLSNRLKELNLKSYGEYYYYLRFDPGRRAELDRLYEVVTTNETSFYRNPPQLQVFQEQILRETVEELRAKRTRMLRIWSAGCSTGEEPYTLGIILHEFFKNELSLWDVKILAHDISEAVLATARAGEYGEYALRTTPKEIVARYFTQENGRYRIKPEVKKLVAFDQINLIDRLRMKQVERCHIIFCRNVIIYFDDEMKKRVISAFYDALLPGGTLLIGHSESLHAISRVFKPLHHPGAVAYRKA